MVAHDAGASDEASLEDRIKQVRQLLWGVSGVQAVGMGGSDREPVVRVYFESQESHDAANLAASMKGVTVEAVVSNAFRAN